MKALIAALIFLTAGSASAAPTYRLNMELSLKGKHVSSSSLVVKKGEKGFISQKSDTDETFIEVLATEKIVNDTEQVELAMSVGYINADGSRRVVATPMILTKLNEQAIVATGDPRGKKEEMGISVIATAVK